MAASHSSGHRRIDYLYSILIVSAVGYLAALMILSCIPISLCLFGTLAYKVQRTQKEKKKKIRASDLSIWPRYLYRLL